MNVQQVISYLKAYDGPPLKFMEVCGTHTSSIFKNGIRDLISPKIHLISGPGCPVCVTPAAYIDQVGDLAMRDHYHVLTFGDMIKVPGTRGSLAIRKGEGAHVDLMYSPFEAIEKAEQHPDITWVVAAVGFETTVPSYALMLDEARRRGLRNIRLVTALKTIIPALDWICANQKDIDGFIAPGHVSVIIGENPYRPLAEKYGKPFVVAGFEAEHLLAVIYDLVRQVEQGKGQVHNLYPNAVEPHGNRKALNILHQCFSPGPAMWRGLGIIPDSGLYLQGDYAAYDAGSRGLDQDMELPKECACAQVITGQINPDQCRMFGTGCTPLQPYGPCMVSAEGACGIWYRNQ